MDVASILLAAQSPDASVRQPAEQQIEAAKASNLVRHCLRHAPALSHHTLLPASLVCSAREAAWRPARRSVSAAADSDSLPSSPAHVLRVPLLRSPC